MFDPEFTTSTLRLGLAAGSAVLLGTAAVLLLIQRRKIALGSATRSGLIILATMLVTSLAWALVDPYHWRDHDPERQALENRADDLSGRALVPGSPLACLDDLAGETVGVGCEKALFASPASVAAAMSYDTARLALLSDMVAYAKGGGTDFQEALLRLRRSLEADRYGFLARVLAVRDGCTSQRCQSLDLLQDSSRVRANLSGDTFGHYLEHYQTVWAQPPTPVAEAPHPEPTPTVQLVPPGQRKVLVNIDFPTADSIPPISIMNPEPATRPGPGAAAAANANQPTTTGPRPPKKQAANPSAQAGPQSAPPSPGTGQAQEDPVWIPNTPAPPPPTAGAAPAPPAAAPAPSLASGAGPPVQLNPFAAPQ